MKTSILIPVYNKAFAIKNVLDALMPQVDGDEIVVLDDGSEDESQDIIRKFNVKLITRERDDSLFFRAASARNMLVREAANEQMIFLAGDCIPREDFLEQHKKAIEEVEPRTIIRGMVGPTPALAFGYQRNWRRMITGNIGLKKWDFNLVGGIDENCDGYWGHEDVEFGYRAVMIYKYRAYFIPAWVDHVDHPKPYKKRGRRNLEYLAWKHMLGNYEEFEKWMNNVRPG